MFALDLLQQYQSMNGSLLAAGKIYVYNLGRTQLATVYGDHNGATPIANPVVLDDQGMAEIYLNDAFNYTIVVFDAYGQEQFSRDIYPKGMGNGESIGTQLYEGVDPIVVNNDLYAISANTTKLGVQEPLYFVQDDAERVVIGFSGEEIPAGTMNESAFGYQDGKITGYNGSAFSAGNTYEEGSYIDIDGNTISVTGLTPVPADTASTGLVASVSADITGMIPDTSDMATQTWVNEQGYLTGVDLTPYQTTADMSGYLKTDDSARFYTTANPSGFINSDAISAMATTGFVADVSGDITALIPSTAGLATEDWVTGQGYLTAHQSLDGLMSADLLEISDNKITGYNGTAFAGQGGGVSGDYELSAGSGISIVDYPLEQKTVISVTAQGGNPEVEQAVIDNSATWDSVTAKQNELIFGYKDTAISSIDNSAIYDNSAHARITTLAGRISDLSSNKLDSAIYANDSGTFLTGLPQDLVYTADIQDMATTGDLTAYATIESLTAKQDAGDYLSATDSANFLLTSDSGNFYPMNQNPSGYLTAHQSLADYQTTADMVNYQTTAGMTAYLTAVPDTYLQNTDLTIVDNKVTEISGVPLSAGDELPSGVMNTSALEYNAVNEISGYNGSAIAQYGAEKQWLVVDDTLLTLSNSAQFALGVNLSAVAQLLGVDETVLWSGEGTSGDFTLTENPLNFNRIRVEYNSTNETINASTHDMGAGEFNFDPSKTTNIILETVFVYTPSANNVTTALNHGFAAYYNTQTTAWNRKMGGWTNKWAVGNPTTISADRHFVFVNKVVGIGRKQ